MRINHAGATRIPAAGGAGSSVPGATRTPDLPLRRRLLYPTELPGPAVTVAGAALPQCSERYHARTPMTQLAQPFPAVAVAPSLARDLVILTKPGIVRLVTITSAVGFALAQIERGWGHGQLLGVAATFLVCLIGTALSAAGANTLNQVMEARRDALMHRTRQRPVAAGRVPATQGASFGVALCIAGVAALWLGTNAVAALVSLSTILCYLLAYTPLKPVTPLALWIGAIPGALPPLIGWSAASEGPWRGLDHPGGWSLFLIMFAWQIPHFLALAWKYRDDYARGGYRVLSLNDETGIATAWHSVLWSIIMIAFSLMPVWAIRAHVGWAYAVASVVLGCAMLHLSVTLLAQRNDRNARSLFLGSVIYLPLVLIVLVADAGMSLLG